MKKITLFIMDVGVLDQSTARTQGPLSRPVCRVSTHSIKGSLKLIEKLEKIGAMAMVTLF